jgi:hypothetical protein
MSERVVVVDVFDKAVFEAEAQLRSGSWSSAAFAALRQAQVERAKARGREYAEVIDLGFRWSGGAPIPHVVSNGSRTVLVCLVEDNDPEWDGTNPQSVSAASMDEMNFAIVEFQLCHAIKFGGPNDESSPNHPLYQVGLRHYDAHEVHNSQWLEDEIAMNAAHRHHVDANWRTLRHFFLAFHDETFEALADDVTVRQARGTMSSLLSESARMIAEN